MTSTCEWIEGEDFLVIIRQGGDPHCGKPTVTDTRGKMTVYCEGHQARVNSRGPSLKYVGDSSINPTYRR